MEHKFISEIEPGQAVDDIYMVKEPVLRSTTRGGLYIAMFLLDRTGQLNARMWQATEETYNSLPKPGFVHIQGRSEVYQNNLQVVVNHVSIVDGSKVDLGDFLARTDKDINRLFQDVKEILSRIKNSSLKRIVDEFLADAGLMEKFKNAPAAATLHHGYLGGLLEHTYNMLRAATVLLPLYPQVQPDLVLAGIFLHDIGKTEELSYDTAFSYTDSGQLLGHISQGLLMLSRKVDALTSKGIDIDKIVIDSLEHIILSHHGEYEFGSPKLPATAEAFMVYYIDDLDAKLNQVTAAIDNEPGKSNWTAWKSALQRRLYRKRIE